MPAGGSHPSQGILPGSWGPGCTFALGRALRSGVQVPLYTVTAPKRPPYFSSGCVLGTDVSLQGLLHMDNSMGPWADGPQWGPALGDTQGGQGVDGPSSDLLVALSPTQRNS